MEINSVTLVYFSPTGTTKTILESIAEGIGVNDIRTIDLTKPDAVSRGSDEIREGMVIIGGPVYGGRIPVEAIERFRTVRGAGVPAVIFALYGNREYDDALLELREIATEQGFKPVAAGAFIGEHSYSTDEKPIAAGRPDEQDIEVARDMGKKIAVKLSVIPAADSIGELAVPGNSPLKERHAMNKIAPETDRSLCTMCQLCVGSCPTAAITVTDEVVTDAESCILCAACVKICPAGARYMVSPQVEKARTFLSENFSERKEPSLFVDQER